LTGDEDYVDDVGDDTRRRTEKKGATKEGFGGGESGTAVRGENKDGDGSENGWSVAREKQKEEDLKRTKNQIWNGRTRRMI
jgi:hypothetical protein